TAENRNISVETANWLLSIEDRLVKEVQMVIYSHEWTIDRYQQAVTNLNSTLNHIVKDFLTKYLSLRPKWWPTNTNRTSLKTRFDNFQKQLEEKYSIFGKNSDLFSHLFIYFYYAKNSAYTNIQKGLDYLSSISDHDPNYHINAI